MWVDFGSGDMYNLDYFQKVVLALNARPGAVIHLRHGKDRYQDVTLRFKTPEKAEEAYHLLRKCLAPVVLDEEESDD